MLAAAPAAPQAAGVGEDWTTLADLHTIKGWLHGLSTAPDLTEVVADGGVSAGDVYQQEAREFAGRLGRIIEAMPAFFAPSREPEGGAMDDLREALIQADLKIRSFPGTDQSDVEFIRAALATRSDDKPGGAVDDGAFKIATDLHNAYEQLIYGLPKYLDAENLTDEENMIREAWITLDVTAHRLAALATREEAPACNTCGGKGYTEHEGGEGEGYPSRPEIEACSCRAQPQAREDAQPVSCQSCGGEVQGWVCQGCGMAFCERDGRLIAGHPAPDALRVAVEALEPFALLAPDEGVDGANMDDPLSKWFTVADLVAARQARLAALQAEQGAK